MRYLKEVTPSQAPDESPIYRSNLCNEQLMYEIPNVTTCYELLLESVRLHNTKKAFGHREIVDIIEESKEIERKVDGAIKTEIKKWSYYQLADYDWWSFEELLEYVKKAGSGFRNLGLKEKDFVGIFAPTNRYWKTIAFGAYSQNLTVVTVYDTLGTDGLSHALNEGEIITLFTSGQLLGNILKVLPKVPKLKNIIYHGMASAKDIEEFGSKTDIKLLKFDELIQLGADNPHEPVPPKAEDLSCIMYTSGTTGTPKGVQLTHANLCGVIGGVQHLTSEYIFKHDVFISMLPLAHILALSVDFYLSYVGMKIGYSSPRTLTDTNVRNCVGDLKALQPTLLIAVPQVYETIRKGIFNKVNSSGAVTKFLFNSVLSLKHFLRQKNLPNGMFDFVFGSIKQLTGGKLRLSVCGGAPLSASLQDFITDALCPMIQGYGLTEVCGLSVVGTPDVAKTGEIGKLSPAFEIKLKDVPDAGYSHKNPNPQGELWYRGQPLSTGYFKNEQETKDAFTDEGWFKTGDVAEITERGTLKIIDRKKNLVKLSNGEYIALEKIESFYRNNQVVNAICVCADSERPKPVAVIVANLDALKNICSERGLTVPEDLEQASRSEEITRLVYKECLDEAKKSGLKGTEIISGIYLAPEEWTVDNDFLTAAQKMKRRNIQSSYKDQINKLFSQIPN